MMITRHGIVKYIFVLFWIVVISSGCFRGTVYEMGGKTYDSRTEAESVLGKVLEERLDNCQTAPRSFDGKCLLILPTSHWIMNNMIAKKKAKSDLMDYTITIIQKETENSYQLINKSGLFSQCEIAQAAVGNGQDEQLGHGNTIEASIGVVDKRIYFIFVNPITNQSIQVGFVDIINSSIYGWGWLFDQVKVLQ